MCLWIALEQTRNEDNRAGHLQYWDESPRSKYSMFHNKPVNKGCEGSFAAVLFYPTANTA